jgi:hypothetical protein
MRGFTVGKEVCDWLFEGEIHFDAFLLAFF